MIVLHGDIFRADPTDAFVVIPTNVGWRRDGSNVMGRGVAKIAATLYPDLPSLYGAWCQERGADLFVCEKYRLICAPSKPLLMQRPNMSWSQKADLLTVEDSYRKLLVWVLSHKDAEVKTPLLGAGNGGIPNAEALRIINSVGFPNRVFLVLYD